MILFLMLSCASGSDAVFDRQAIMMHVLARVDTDGDGQISAPEYARVDFSGPSFAQADTDHDGGLSAGEVRVLSDSQDPTYFYKPPSPGRMLGGPPVIPGGARPDGPRHPDGKNAVGSAGPPGPGPLKLGTGGGGRAKRSQPPRSLLLLRFLREEVAAADPTIPLPSRNEVERIGRTATLESPEARALLKSLESASGKAEIDFPRSLRAEPAKGL